jgi:excisionase family DNA binding protein
MEATRKPVSNVETRIEARLLFRPRTVAEITDQSVSKIYKDMALGLLKTVRLGRSVRIPAAELRKYIGGTEVA